MITNYVVEVERMQVGSIGGDNKNWDIDHGN
jgi:hypothetical protein